MAGPVRWRSCICALAVAGCVLASVPDAAAQPVAPQAAAEVWRLPHPLPTPAVPEVAFVGDSIGRDAEGHVRAQVERTHRISYYHAVAAGHIAYHLPRLLPVVKASDGPDIVLVELGTGDAFWDLSTARFEADVRRLLDRVLPYVTCIRWFDQKPTANVAYPEVNEHRTAFNRVLDRVLAEPQYASRNAALVSYSAWSDLAGNAGYFLADRLHHTERGRRELGLLARQAADGCDPGLTSGPFWDVPDREESAAAIGWMGTSGVAPPYRNGTYRARLGSIRPTVNRAEVAGFLWRMAGSPSAPASTWAGVPASIRTAVGWLRQEHVLRGDPSQGFRPTGAVTRGDMVTYLWRLAGSPKDLPAHRWTDAPPELAKVLNWVDSVGLFPGSPDGAFHPAAFLTRIEVAEMLDAYRQLPAETNADPPASPAAPDPPASPATAVPPAAPAPSDPSTSIPPTTGLPPASLPPTSLPPTSLPPTSLPPTMVPPVTVPAPVPTSPPTSIADR